MMRHTNITRRGFLIAVAYLISSRLLPFDGNFDAFHKAGKREPLPEKLAKFYIDKKSAKVVGLAYLRSVPSEARVELLVDRICSFNGSLRGELAQADAQKIRELMLSRQRQDFEHERVVNIRGWILSETECRLCALTALI